MVGGVCVFENIMQYSLTTMGIYDARSKNDQLLSIEKLKRNASEKKRLFASLQGQNFEAFGGSFVVNIA